MKMNFAVATLVLGSVLIAAPGPSPAAPDHRGHGVSASHAGHRDRGYQRGPRGDYGRYGDHRRRDGHYAPFSHHGYRKHGRYGGHRSYWPRRHYRGYRRYSGHRYDAPGYHYHRHRPVVQLYADYDAYVHCPTHGGYFLVDDLYYY